MEESFAMCDWMIRKYIEVYYYRTIKFLEFAINIKVNGDEIILHIK